MASSQLSKIFLRPRPFFSFSLMPFNWTLVFINAPRDSSLSLSQPFLNPYVFSHGFLAACFLFCSCFLLAWLLFLLLLVVVVQFFNVESIADGIEWDGRGEREEAKG